MQPVPRMVSTQRKNHCAQILSLLIRERSLNIFQVMSQCSRDKILAEYPHDSGDQFTATTLRFLCTICAARVPSSYFLPFYFQYSVDEVYVWYVT